MSRQYRQEESGRRWYSGKIEDITFTSDKLSDISCPQDCVSFTIFICYRSFVAGYFLGFLIYLIVMRAYGAKFLFYLNVWTYVEVTLYLFAALLNAAVDDKLGFRGSEGPSRRLGRFHRIRYQFQWLLFNISVTSSIIITLVYWPFVPPKEDVSSIFNEVNTNLFPSIFCLVDLLVTKITVRYSHVLYPALYLLTYGVFVVVYWAAGGTYTQRLSVLKDPPIALAIFFGGMFATFLVHGLVKLIYCMRVRWVDRRASTLEVSDADGEREPLSGQGQSGDYTSEVKN